MADLKPCPFCGGDVKITIGIFGSSMIVCDKCGAEWCIVGDWTGLNDEFFCSCGERAEG